MARGVSHGTPCSPSFTQCVLGKILPGATAGHFTEEAPCDRAQGWCRRGLPEDWLVSGGSVGHAHVSNAGHPKTHKQCATIHHLACVMASQRRGLTGSSDSAMTVLRHVLSRICLVSPFLTHSQRTIHIVKTHMLVRLNLLPPLNHIHSTHL
jgi:hypothetical protein